MFANGRKTIGVFMSQVYVEFQNNLCKGISTRAMELNYNVAFFTNFGGYGQEAYDIGERNIANLPQYEDLDGIILVPDTIVVQGLETYIEEQIKNRAKCPVVSIRRKIDDYYNVMIDDTTVIEEIIVHFIEKHGFTRINFLAGPKDFPDSEKRLESYKQILTKHQIPIEEERIYYGDFWKREGIKAVDQWLSSPLERPQAIICANDYMAITVCSALRAKGISVPEDIAVSGCDDLEDAAEYSPSITTARMPIFEMGIEAVEKIHKHNLKMEQPKDSYMRTITIYRESCGCKKNWYQESNEIRINHIALRESLTTAMAHNAYMSTALTGLNKLTEVTEKIWYYIYENAGFTHFCLCFKNDWNNYHRNENEEEILSSDDEEMLMEMGHKNRVGYSYIKFMKSELVPPEFSEDQPMVYYFAILHHQENCFGYVAIRFENIQTYELAFQAWLINVCNALENVRVHSELNRLMYKLEDMYIRDDLTDLYNRRGLDILGQKYLKRCFDEHVNFMVFTADMDKLKYINDNYGHAKGDIAIKVVADALQQAADDDEICMRFGGDEFMAIGLDYDENKLNNFINKFVELLDKFNQETNYDFKVYVSYGTNLIIPEEKTTVEECLLLADARMYQQKYEKEIKKIKANLSSNKM